MAFLPWSVPIAFLLAQIYFIDSFSLCEVFVNLITFSSSMQSVFLRHTSICPYALSLLYSCSFYYTVE